MPAKAKAVRDCSDAELVEMMAACKDLGLYFSIRNEQLRRERADAEPEEA